MPRTKRTFTKERIDELTYALREMFRKRSEFISRVQGIIDNDTWLFETLLPFTDPDIYRHARKQNGVSVEIEQQGSESDDIILHVRIPVSCKETSKIPCRFHFAKLKHGRYCLGDIYTPQGLYKGEFATL